MTNKILKNSVAFVKRHLSDVHAQNVVCLPVFAVSESLNGFSVAQSINAREGAYASGLLGIGFLYARGNDIVRRGVSKLGFDSKLSQSVTDTAYGGAFFYGYSAGLYMATSSLKFDEAQSAAISAGIIGLGIGGGLGYVTNLWRDCFNISNPDGKPTFARNASLKKRIAALSLSALVALGVTVATYKANEHYSSNQRPTLEKISTP